MKRQFSLKRVIITLAVLVVAALLAVAARFFSVLDLSSFNRIRTVTQLTRGRDVGWANLRRLDLRDQSDVIATLHFNQRTLWPKAARLPPAFDSGALLTNAMNPGLGIRELHRQGITGRGVRVAILDQYLPPDPPEDASRIVAQQNFVEPPMGSMHGHRRLAD